jgi:hypothetical protein
MNQPPANPVNPPFDNLHSIVFNDLVVGRYYYVHKNAPLIAHVTEKTAQDVTFVIIQEWQEQLHRWGFVQQEEETCPANEVGTNQCMVYIPGNGGKRRKTRKSKKRHTRKNIAKK